MRKMKLLPISRCADCTNCIKTGKAGQCGITRHAFTPQQYCNEGFPLDCPLEKKEEQVMRQIALLVAILFTVIAVVLSVGQNIVLAVVAFNSATVSLWLYAVAVEWRRR